jgi:MFS family permease
MLLLMFIMGSFASLYHPAGLSAISRMTTVRDRGMALGYHGVLGSMGIAGAPLFAGAMLGSFGWRDVYLVLLVPGVLLGLLVWYSFRDGGSDSREGFANGPGVQGDDHSSAAGQLLPFLLLCTVSAVYGFIYRGFLTFLPRYLGGIESPETAAVVPTESVRNYLSAMVLAAGIGGQFVAGHLAGRVNLEKLMLVILAGNAPFLFWMGRAEDAGRILAAVGFALVFFMWQPVSNCLIAKYTSPSRRSLGYGLSFFLSFGLGSTGATFAGWVADRYNNLAALYPILGYLALASAGLAILIWLTSGGRDG